LYWLFGWLGITAFNVAVPFIAAAFGLLSLDLAQFSGYREMLDNVTGIQGWLAMAPIQTLAMWAILTLPLWSLLNLPFNFGEEWGWRGYLLPQLLPLGQWRALLISGPIWGLWHAPIILLGFDYPQHHFLGVLCIVITCTLIGIILGWTRLATGSVWPAVLGHAAFDGSAAAYGIVATAGVTYDTVLVGPIGLTGWIVPLLFIVLLVVARRLPVRNPPDLAAPAQPVVIAPAVVAPSV
jgi:membrane protease YdiL (CAAX protease family)